MRPQRLSSLILVFVCIFLSHILVSKYLGITYNYNYTSIKYTKPRHMATYMYITYIIHIP